jgi:hypothetical protein
MTHFSGRILRANLVLLSFCITLADTGWMIFDWSMPVLTVSATLTKAVVGATAIGMMLYVRRLARDCFRLAIQEGHIDIGQTLERAVAAVPPAVPDSCPHAWLVQLHLDASLAMS